MLVPLSLPVSSRPALICTPWPWITAGIERLPGRSLFHFGSYERVQTTGGSRVRRDLARSHEPPGPQVAGEIAMLDAVQEHCQ